MVDSAEESLLLALLRFNGKNVQKYRCKVFYNVLIEFTIYRAAQVANAHEFIQSFPQGYDTVVGERGVTLSGGQKQRVAIARAVLKEPPILILDEATSALDSASEKVVQKALETAGKGRTVLVIAHRLSTIMNADVIVVLNKGKIVEMGNHDQLKKQKGFYWNLIKQQDQEESSSPRWL